MERNYMISDYLQGIFWAELGMRVFNSNANEKEIDAAKEFAMQVIESQIDENPTLTKTQKDENKRQLKSWSDSVIRGFKDALRYRGSLSD